MIRRLDRAKLCSSVSTGFAKDLQEIFMHDVFANVMFLNAYGLFKFFLGPGGYTLWRAGRRIREEAPNRPRS